MNFIFNLMLPLGALLYMNISIYKGLQRLHQTPINNGQTENTTKSSEINGCSSSITHENEEERERDARFTRASILMVLAFGLCHTPRLISNTVEMFIDQADLPHVRFGIYVSPPKPLKLQTVSGCWPGGRDKVVLTSIGGRL